MKRRHESPQSALADIALLLLVFFLITTQFPKEEGIKTTLPPLNVQSAAVEYNELTIWLNEMDQIMVNEQRTNINQLSSLVYQSIDESTQTRINLKSHVNATYAAYVQVYDEVKKGYLVWYNKEANRRYQKPFDALNNAEKNQLKSERPLSVFEGDLVQ